jgi:hypothetical protein
MKIDNKKLSLKAILAIAFLASCTDHYCDGLTTAIASQCEESESKCNVSFKDAFTFEWDSLYVFDSMLYPDEVSRRLGFDCECDIVPEGKRLVVFTKDGGLVEEYLSECHEVSFVQMRVDGVVAIGRRSSFELDKRLLNKRMQYYLSRN